MFASTRLGNEEASIFLGLKERLRAFVARCIRGFSQRQALSELARLDDRMLKDIGLFRADIDTAESLPLGSDRIALLVSRRRARCNARFANRYF
jgi:uncharacterized protein YjiS (DUF1127 family)